MAKSGCDVTVLEKHSTPGGRARQLSANGFHFDMGPSWYWMPDVFERYFASFGRTIGDYYLLQRLDPSYRIFWQDSYTDIPSGIGELKKLFESWEKGAGERLDKFLAEAAFKYKSGMQKMVFQPGLSFTEFASLKVLLGFMRMDMFSSVSRHISKYFRHEKIRQLLEFPVLFLGARPENTPALYTLMNYADIEGGTWYPKGGIYSIVKAMYSLALELGVKFIFDEEVTGFAFEGKKINRVLTAVNGYEASIVIASADYNFVEQQLLPGPYRTYTGSYWEKKRLAPSCILYYVGIDKKINNVRHHNLFFDTSFIKHSEEIYDSKLWPENPLFYVSVSSQTDDSVAPSGCENLFFLIPVAAGLSGDSEELREKYFQNILRRFEAHTGEKISANIVYRKSFACTDFVNEYHSFRGNAYGLANTLRQTANLKPKCKSSKIKNLYYTGQLTVPGPGVPPSLISGEVVAKVASSDSNR
jgi:phytoene desaturase